MPLTERIKKPEIHELKERIREKYLKENTHILELRDTSYKKHYSGLCKYMGNRIGSRVSELNISEGLLSKLFYDTIDREEITFQTAFLDACYLFISEGKYDRENYYLALQPVEEKQEEEVASVQTFVEMVDDSVVEQGVFSIERTERDGETADLVSTSASNRKLILGGGGLFLLVLIGAFWWYPNNFAEKNITSVTKEYKKTVDNLAQQFDHLVSVDAAKKGKDVWLMGQVMVALQSKSKDKMLHENMLALFDKKKNDQGVWSYSKNDKASFDLRATAWVLYALAFTQEPVDSLSIQTVLDHQLVNGAWSTFPVKKKEIKYSSVYSTCLVLLALDQLVKNQLVSSTMIEAVVEQKNKGLNWLRYSTEKQEVPLWRHYPEHKAGMEILSVSGMALHTINRLSKDVPQKTVFNKNWLTLLAEMGNDIEQITIRKIEYWEDGSVLIEDNTNYCSMPWLLIATKDVFDDPNLSETDRASAQKWLSQCLEQLSKENTGDLKIYPWLRAVHLIAFKYIKGVDLI